MAGTTKRGIGPNHWPNMTKKRRMPDWPVDMPVPPRWYVPQWLQYTNTSQVDLVEATGLSKSYVSELVNGKERFNQDILWMFAHVIKCPWGALLDINPLTEDGRMLAELMLARRRRKAA